MMKPTETLVYVPDLLSEIKQRNIYILRYSDRHSGVRKAFNKLKKQFIVYHEQSSKGIFIPQQKYLQKREKLNKLSDII